ncbi:hypothetical protein L085_07415 [Serratia sp. FS14]|uniref:hypothetical protein n=1 Tax=Serratia sp. (strain FS14) TaxID=1327989 RepID=UPI00049951F2|nr:hypothetical protein [Serratia sp. FS14]AIA46934.1 hypothetical protein L085_07415 [Serratia sp. FS14]
MIKNSNKVLIICDRHICFLGIRFLLNEIGVYDITLGDNIIELPRIISKVDNNVVVIVDSYHHNLREVACEILKRRKGRVKAIVFSDTLLCDRGNIVFMHRAESIAIIKCYLHMIFLDGCIISPKVSSIPKYQLKKLTRSDIALLISMLEDDDESGMMRKTNKISSAISKQQRKVMGKLMVNTARELRYFYGFFKHLQ